MKMRFVYWLDDTWTSRRIRAITKGIASHVIIEFALDDSPYPLFFESTGALHHHPEAGMKNGLWGPFGIDVIEKRKQTVKGGRTIEQEWLPITEDEAWHAFQFYSEKCATIRYASPQIGRNWLRERFGIGLYIRQATRNSWSCSEAGARGLPPDILVRYLEIGQITYDDVVPSSRRKKLPGGLYEAMERCIAEHRMRRLL